MRFTPFTFAGGQEFAVDFIVVGGGARGGTLPNAHGGGGGGTITGSISTYPGDLFNIIVGAGGTVSNINGQTSSLEVKSTTTYYAAGGNDGMSGNGFISGSSITCGGFVEAGGGGGANQTGSQANCLSQPIPGRGGNGTLWLNSIYYGGGGGAGQSNPTAPYAGDPGFGGGGIGGAKTEAGVPYAAQNGFDGFGGGGGGQGVATGSAGDGGSGSVVIRYLAPQRAYGGNTVFESGSYVYHTFTTNGTLTT